MEKLVRISMLCVSVIFLWGCQTGAGTEQETGPMSVTGSQTDPWTQFDENNALPGQVEIDQKQQATSGEGEPAENSGPAEALEEKSGIRKAVAAPEVTQFTVPESTGGIRCNVDALIYIPEGKAMSVARGKREDYEDEDLRPLCDALFQGNRIYYVNEGDVIVDNDIQQKKEVEYRLENMSIFERNSFRVYGEVNGETVRLDIIQDNPEQFPGSYNSMRISFGDLEASKYFVQNPEYSEEDIKSVQYTLEEAAELCEEKLAVIREALQDVDAAGEFSLTDVKYGEKMFAGEMDGEEKSKDNSRGYQLYYVRQAGEVIDMYHPTDEYPPGPEEFIIFTVTDNGIEEIVWFNRVSFEEVVSENIKLLSYDQIEEKFKEYINYENYDWLIELNPSGFDVNAINLTYYYVNNPGNSQEFMSIPVWDFDIVLINAINGEFIMRDSVY